MRSKKFNAVITWILMILLLIHITATQLYLTAGIFSMPVIIIVPKVLGIICLCHVCMSLAAVFFMNDGPVLIKYGKLNIRTLQQRLSGLFILLLVHPHVKLFESFIYEGLPLSDSKKVIVFIVEMFFFGTIFLHIDCSFTNSFISMGMIRSENTERGMNRAVRIVCVLSFAFIFIALARFLVMWDPS